MDIPNWSRKNKVSHRQDVYWLREESSKIKERWIGFNVPGSGFLNIFLNTFA